MTKTLTAETGVFSGLSEAEVGAGRVSLFIGVGADNVAAWAVVADVEFGVASCGVVVESESTAYFGCLTPDQLNNREFI